MSVFVNSTSTQVYNEIYTKGISPTSFTVAEWDSSPSYIEFLIKQNIIIQLNPGNGGQDVFELDIAKAQLGHKISFFNITGTTAHIQIMQYGQILTSLNIPGYSLFTIMNMGNDVITAYPGC